MKHLKINLVILVFLILSLFPSCKKTSNSELLPDTTCGNVTDTDGNVYSAIKIGDQCWMQKNLNVSHYANGDTIPEVEDPATWTNLTTGAWCYYEGESANGAVYGKLYNWYAVNDPRGLAPMGWHVPSDTEWTVLTNFLGGDLVAGGKMKEAGPAHWIIPATGNNSSGFSGLPGGYRGYIGTFFILGQNSFWWSSTEINVYGWNRYLDSGDDRVEKENGDKSNGYSVRCLSN